MKYCGNCGSKVEGNFCQNCGTQIKKEEVSNQYNEEVNNYFLKKIESKKNHDVYRLVTGIVMIVLGAIILFAGLYIDSSLKSGDIRKYIEFVDYINIDFTFTFILPGLLVLAGGILSIVSKVSNSLLLISGILYLVAAVINLCSISTISLLFIICCVFGPINIAFYTKTR